MKCIKGIGFCAIFTLIAYCTSQSGFCKSIDLNSLTLAMGTENNGFEKPILKQNAKYEREIIYKFSTEQ